MTGLLAGLPGPEWWCNFAAVGVPGFVAGFICGWLSEARKDIVMARVETARGWFDRNFRWLYFGALVLAIIGIGVAVSASVTNARQDSDQNRLLACFDDYAKASSSSTQVVREATKVRDEATQVRDRAFTDLFEYVFTDPPEDSPEGLRLFTALTDANAALVEAQITLALARRDNPVPPPPSRFCDEDGPDSEPTPSPTGRP